jgi:predicted acyl esterase
MSRSHPVLALLALLCVAFPARAGGETVVSKGVKIPLPGGAHLVADIVRPAAPGRYPVIYVHTCYGRRHVSSPAKDSPFHAELTAYDRYAYVATDWRGYPPPPGKPVDRRIDVGKDGAAAVEWIAAQPFCNGKVGIWGHSAVAGAAFKVMRERPEHLVCAVPASGSDGLRYEQFFYGGVLEKQHWDVGTRVGHHVLEPLLKRNTYDWLWRRIDGARKPMPSRIPVLLISGWFDTNPSLKLAMFDELRTAYGEHAGRVKLIAGPWQHSAFGMLRQGAVEFPAAEGASGEATLRFFDWHLCGEDNGWDERPSVRFFVMGEKEWRDAEEWPPAAKTRTFRLMPDGTLSDQAPEKAGKIEWVHDPAKPVPTTGGASILELKWSKTKAGPFDLKPILERADVKRFVTATLAKDVVVAGRAKAVLHVSSDQADTDIALWLADVGPEGRALLVADGIRRLSFRNSRSRPQPLTPGKVHEVTVSLTPTAVVFRKGHRILLVVASSNFPRFDRHPARARNALHLGPAHPGRLELPVLSPGAR